MNKSVIETHFLRIISITLIALGIAAIQPSAHAQSTWNGAGVSTNMNWNNAANWTGGVPGSSSAVTFPDNLFPVTTNVLGAVNNIVQSSTTISTLTYNNITNNYHTTQIPQGTTLTIAGVSGNTLSVGINDAAVTLSNVVTITGGGSLIVGNGSSILSGQSGTGSGAPSLLDLSGLTNFVLNFGGGSSGAVNLGTGSSGSGISVKLAAISNNITCGTFNIGNNNTRGNSAVYLGNGTNIINADTINMGISKTVGTMAFANNSGGLTIASHTGTGRAALNISGEANTGSTTAANNGNLLLNGGFVNILASTLALGNRAGRASATANGVISFDGGTFDATTINMALNTSGGGAANGVITVGGTGVLKIGSGGLSMVNQGGAAGSGTLVITNGGTAYCSNNIYKTTATGVGTVALDSGSLNMTSLTGTIGVSNALPIDIFNINNSVLTLPVAATANIVVSTLTANANTQNTINVSVLPPITSYPSQFPVISYQTGGGNLNSFAVGTLPGVYAGYISNNVGGLSIDLVVTNGPLAKADEWGGGVNNLWDTTTLNWTNAGVAVAYNDVDSVTFDDLARTNIVNLTGVRAPFSLTFNNNVLNYTLTGVGKLGGPVQLVKNNGASLTLTETGGDNFVGGLVINGGMVVLDNAGSAISGGVTIGSGTTLQIGNNDANGALPGGAVDDEGTLIFRRSNNLLVGANISGAGTLTQNGNGMLSLSVSNGYTGNTTISAGILSLTNSGAIASSPQVSVSSAGLDTSGVSGSTILQTLNMTNSTLTVKVGYLQTNQNVTALNMGGANNTINVRTLPPIAHYPATLALVQSGSPIVGYNFVLNSLPAGSAGTISLSGDSTAVLLTLTSGPTGTRPSVTWSGVDALGNVSTNWSDAFNWQTPGVPSSSERVTFNATAAANGSPFDNVGDGNGGIVSPGNINNIVDINVTNASLTYANGAATYHNTSIAAGKTLVQNGPVTVSGSGVASVLGTGGTFQINNPGNSTTLVVENGTAPTLDMSGLDTLNATVNQIAIGFNPSSSSSTVNGVCYLARTNTITTGSGYSGIGAALVIAGSANQSGVSSGQLYLGQTNALFVDGIVLGPGPSINGSFSFNPAFVNPVAYIRGITGPNSRVTLWSLGDSTVNINNHAGGYGHTNDFSAGTLNARVDTLIVGQGAQGNTVNPNVMGTFSMGAGNLDVTTLTIGAFGKGGGGNGIGIMSVSGGTLLAGSLALATAGPTSAGTLNLTNASLTVSSGGITIGSGTAGGVISEESSTIKLLNGGSMGSPTVPVLTLTLSNGVFQVDADGAATAARIVATTVNTNGTTVINLGSIVNVSGIAQIPLLAYTGNDPFGSLSLGTFPAGYTVGLVDNIGNSSVDLSITNLVKPRPYITHFSISGGITLNIQGTNGAGGEPYVLLGSTNVVLPISQWTPILTDSFALDGSFNLSTNVINPAIPKQFYLLSQ